MTRRTILLCSIVILSTLFGSCGGVSAPPVELPAPITGRIDVSAPDTSGIVHITGTEGAVPAGSMVMVVNETVASTITGKLLDAIVPNAFAQTPEDGFPLICEEPGYACTLADDAGAFVIVIAAAVGDQLAIGIVDPATGEFLSDLLRVTVPTAGEPSPELSCTGAGVSGEVADIKIAPTSGIPILLKKGSETTTNQLVLKQVDPITVPINGCHAHSLAVIQTPTGDIVVATSQEDRILWTGRLAGEVMHDKRSFVLSDEPMHVVFAESSQQPIVALRTSDSVILARLTLADGSIQSTLAVDSPAVSGLTRSLSLKTHIMGDAGGEHYLGLLLADADNFTDAYVMLFQADGMIFKEAWSREEINAFSSNSVDAESFVNAELYSYYDQGQIRPLRILIIDAAGSVNVMHEYGIQYYPAGMSSPQDLSLYDDLVTLSLDKWEIPQHEVQHTTPQGSLPLETIAIRETQDPATMRAFFISTNAEGNLYLQDPNDDPSQFLVIPWAAGHDIPAIDFLMNAVYHELFGADATDGVSILGSLYLPL